MLRLKVSAVRWLLVATNLALLALFSFASSVFFVVKHDELKVAGEPDYDAFRVADDAASGDNPRERLVDKIVKTVYEAKPKPKESTPTTTEIKPTEVVQQGGPLKDWQIIGTINLGNIAMAFVEEGSGAEEGEAAALLNKTRTVRGPPTSRQGRPTPRGGRRGPGAGARTGARNDSMVEGKPFLPGKYDIMVLEIDTGPNESVTYRDQSTNTLYTISRERKPSAFWHPETMELRGDQELGIDPDLATRLPALNPEDMGRIDGTKGKSAGSMPAAKAKKDKDGGVGAAADGGQQPEAPATETPQDPATPETPPTPELTPEEQGQVEKTVDPNAPTTPEEPPPE